MCSRMSGSKSKNNRDGKSLDWGLGQTLAFHDLELEKEYLSSMSKTWTKIDGIMQCLGVVMGLVEICKISGQGLFAIIPAIIMVCESCVLLSMNLRDPDWYGMWRVNGLWWVKPLTHLAYGICVRYSDKPEVWYADNLPLFILRCSARTVFVPMIFNIVDGQLPFKKKSIILLLGSGSFLGWVASLNNACNVEDSVRSIVHTLGWITEVSIVRITLLGFPCKIESPTLGEYPCWQVAASYGIFLEVLVPAFVIYTRECNSRVRFLKDRVTGDQVQECREQILEYKRMAVLYLVVCSQAVWFLTRLIAKFDWAELCSAALHGL